MKKNKISKERIFVFPKEKTLSCFHVYEIHFKKGLSRKVQAAKVQILARRLFCDPVCERFATDCCSLISDYCYIVWLKDGVYDAEGEMALYCAQRLGLADGIEKIKFGKGSGSKQKIKELCNPLVETTEKLS